MARKTKQFDPPESPTSVGYTEARHIRLATAEDPFPLDCGAKIGPVDVEYETYGKLSAAKDNVVLIVHHLSADAHVAGWDPHAIAKDRPWRARGPGWWDDAVGPGKAIDTNKYFVVCANFLGSCYGTTGPTSINPATGKPYGLSFPVVMVGDWVRLQLRLLQTMGIERVHAVIGGSLGGQQALEWALAYPDRVDRCIVLAATPRLSAQGLAFNAVGRQSIMSDPNFNGGQYYNGPHPDAGLAIARMMAHITYLSDQSMHEKFGRRLQGKQELDFGFGVEFEVESYLDYQGRAFVERFDANSYLYITRAMDYYDAAARWGGGNLTEACRRIKAKVMAVSFSSDWLYPPGECREFALALCQVGRAVTYVNVPSRYGHDAFLLEMDTVAHLVGHFINNKNSQ